MVANGSHQVTFAQIEQMVTKLFDRYDTDESGTMNNWSELVQLTTNVCFKLKVKSFAATEVERLAGAIEPFEFDRAQSCRWIYDNIITLHEQPSSKHQASSEQQLCSKGNIISNKVNTSPELQAELPVSSEEEGRVSAQSQADTDECSSIESEKSEKDKLPVESACNWGVEAANSQLEAAGKRLTFTWDPIEAGIALPATMTQTQEESWHALFRLEFRRPYVFLVNIVNYWCFLAAWSLLGWEENSDRKLWRVWLEAILFFVVAMVAGGLIQFYYARQMRKLIKNSDTEWNDYLEMQLQAFQTVLKNMTNAIYFCAFNTLDFAAWETVSELDDMHAVARVWIYFAVTNATVAAVYLVFLDFEQGHKRNCESLGLDVNTSSRQSDLPDVHKDALLGYEKMKSMNAFVLVGAAWIIGRAFNTSMLVSGPGKDTGWRTDVDSHTNKWGPTERHEAWLFAAVMLIVVSSVFTCRQRHRDDEHSADSDSQTNTPVDTPTGGRTIQQKLSDTIQQQRVNTVGSTLVKLWYAALSWSAAEALYTAIDGQMQQDSLEFGETGRIFYHIGVMSFVTLLGLLLVHSLERCLQVMVSRLVDSVKRGLETNFRAMRLRIMYGMVQAELTTTSLALLCGRGWNRTLQLVFKATCDGDEIYIGEALLLVALCIVAYFVARAATNVWLETQSSQLLFDAPAQAVGFETVDDQLDTLDLKPPARPNT